MSSPHERPGDNQGPSQFPPRRSRDGESVRRLSANSPPNSVNWRLDRDVANDGFAANEDRIYASMGSRRSTGKFFISVGQVLIVVLISAAVALLVVELLPSKPKTDANGIPTDTTSIDRSPLATNQLVPATPERQLDVVRAPAPVTAQRNVITAAPVANPPRVAVLPPSGPPVQGVTPTEIRFGISAPFSGPARELGRQMKIGLDAAFSVANDEGGIFGRKLRLVAADDGYEPARTANTMKKLYDKDKIFGIVGNVGTPTAVVAVPYALQHKMLFFGGFTGAGLLRRDPPDRYVFNYRASYAEETNAVVRYLVKVRRIKPEQIAVFAQQDSYGDAGFAGVAKAMRELRGGDGTDILRLNYTRNTVDVDEAVAHLRKSPTPIKAVVMVAAYRAAAKFIEKVHKLFPAMIFTNVSFTGSTALANELMLRGPQYAKGVIVTQVVPAVDSYSTVVLKYKSALDKYATGEAPDYVSLEGYLVGTLLADALKRNGRNLNTETLVNTLEGMHKVDLGLGVPVSFSAGNHQGVHKVWGTELDSTGHYKSIDLE